MLDFTPSCAANVVCDRLTGIGLNNLAALVVFDGRLSDLDLLYQALLPSVAGYTIDANDDALLVITGLLAETGAKKLSIVAHGEPGVVHIGVQPLDLQQIKDRSALLQEWCVDEIALYACEVGASTGFIGQLAAVTGSTVTASTTKVGCDRLGGNWELDIASASSTSLFTFTPKEILAYAHILPLPVGPNVFGYAATSTTFQSINLVPGNSGVISILTNDDDAFATVSLGSNSFNFYGTNYSTIYVSSNGLITFGSGNTAFNNSDLSTNPSQASIAILWDDLVTYQNPADQVLYTIQGNKLIVEWNDVQHYPSSPSGATFQAILQLNTGSIPGNFTLNYVDLDFGDAGFNNGANATIGIRNATGDQLLVSLNDSSGSNIGSGKAITFTNAPILSAITAPSAVTELATASAQDLTAITGILPVRDLDVGNTLAASVVGAPIVKLNGTTITTGYPTGLTTASVFTLGSPITSNGNAQTIGYTYNPGAVNLDFLRAGQSLTITYTVRVSDGTANSGTQEVTFTITGTNDIPVLTGTAATISAGTENVTYTINKGQLLGGYTDADNSETATLNVKDLTLTSAQGTFTTNDSGLTYNFTPTNPEFNGTVNFSYTIVDVQGATVAANQSFTINAVNDAPTVISGQSVRTLTAISEDMIDPSGDTVANLFSLAFTDATDQVTGGSNANTFYGIAITGNPATVNGEWEYSLDGGGSWLSVPTGNSFSNRALVLDSTTKLRFLPAPDYFGPTSTITARLIEDGGIPPATDTTVNLATAGSTGGTTRYSSGRVTLTTSITGVNDAPIILSTGANQTYTENGIAAGGLFINNIVNPGNIQESGQSLTTLTLTVDNIFAGDRLNFNGSPVDIATSGTTLANGFTVVVSVSGTTANLTVSRPDNIIANDLQNLLSNLSYSSTSDNPTNYNRNNTRTITLTSLTDKGSAVFGNPDLTTTLNIPVTVTIAPVNDPVVAVGDTNNVTEAGGVNNNTQTGIASPISGNVLTNDIDPDNTISTPSGGTPPLSSLTVSAIAGGTVGSSLTGTYGTITLSADGSYTYTLNNAIATTQGIRAGQTATETFIYIVTDGSATSQSTLTITINGANDTPTLGAPSSNSPVNEALNASAQDLAAIIGTLPVQDADVGNTLTASIVGSPVVKLNGTSIASGFPTGLIDSGVLTFSAPITSTGAAQNITYTYNPGPVALDFLAAGQSLTMTYVVQVDDGIAVSTPQDLVFTITGTNDRPVITTAVGENAGVVTESGNLDIGTVVPGTATTTGTLTSSDVDADATATWSIAGTSEYGDIAIDENSGEWTYTLNNTLAATQALKEGESTTETFTATVTDDFGATATQNVTITFNGTNDSPVITTAVGDNVGAVTEAGNLDAGTVVSGTATTTGTLTSSDVDADATATWGIAGTSEYGDIEIDANTGIWTYTLNNTLTATQALKEGQSTTETFTATVTDDFGATATQNVTVTFNGANDSPVITTAVGDNVGAVTEAGNLDIGTVVSGTATTIGTLTSSDVDADATATWSIAGTSEYGDIEIDANTGIWTYTLNNTLTATQALKEGESTTETFTATVTDDFGATATQNVTITFNGTNDSPVITTAVGDNVGAVSEAGNLDIGTVVSGTDTTTGTLTSSDVDADATATWSIAGTSEYGDIEIDANTGTWTYTLNNALAATQALKEGQSTTEIFIAIITDDFGATATQNVTITFNGTNDSPVITTAVGDNVGAVTEAGNLDAGTVVSGTATTTGTLTSSDVDADATATWSIAGTSEYGDIEIDANTGIWTYTLNNTLTATQALKEGQSTTETFTATVTDDFGATATQNVTVTFNGANDSPVITTAVGDNVGAVTEAGNLDIGTVVSGTDTTIGTLTSSDVDADATATWSIAGTSEYGDIEIDANTGIWTYTLNNTLTATQALKEGESTTETFTATVTDDFGATATQNVTITFNGTNDSPVITTAVGNNVGAVTEAGNLDIGTVVSGTDTTTGTLTSSDVDADATATWSIAGTSEYGDIEIDANTGTWTYTLNNALAATQALKEGASTTETFTATVTDDFGATATQNVTITFNGTNDSPVITTAVGDNAGAVSEAGNLDIGTVVSGTATTTGTLTSTDVDADATATWSIAGTSEYGDIEIDANTGTWTYTLNNTLAATQALKEGESTTETFTAIITDDFGATATQNVTITFNGTNDSPTITSNAAAAVGVVTEAGNSDAGTVVPGTRTATGKLTSNDVDTNATATWSITGTSAYGSIAIKARTGAWTYKLNNTLAATQALKEGQNTTENFTATVTDDFGTTATQVVTITFNGTNDSPTITGSSSASATEDVEAGDSLTGILTATDVDNDQGWTTTNGSGAYGNYQIDVNGHWSYEFTNVSEFDALNIGDTLTDTFTVETIDGTSQTVTVNINGVNDAPTLTDEVTALTLGAEDTVYTINQADLLVGFTDVDGGDLSVSELTATNGILTNNGDGTSTFAPNVNYDGLVELSYNVIDGNGGSTNATHSFTIAAAPAIKHAGDFDGDGKSEILWRHNDGSVAIWELNGTSNFTIAAAPIIGNTAIAPIDWKIADTGDFDGDGKSEILWRKNDGSVAIWKLDGTSDFITVSTPIIASAAIAPTDWKISGTGDFDGDGKSEILWRKNDGSVAIWKLNGTSDFTLDTAPIIGSAAIAPLDWKISGTGDFDGDGKSEILWYNNNDRRVAIWKLDGTSDFTLDTAPIVGIAPANSKIKGIDDLDGDSKSEIVWRNNDGSVAIWKLDGTSAFTLASDSVIASAIKAPTDWRTSATGDFNGNGTSEILWRNSSGAVAIWELDGTNSFTPIVAPVIANAASAPNVWGIAAPI